MANTPKFLKRNNGASIAYHKSEGTGPGVVFLGGFMSDMDGTKAVALETHCQQQGRAYLRFDYQGHGQSSGEFTDGTIGMWAEDAIGAISELTDGPQILVGSSMGGWIMLLAALERPERVAALVGIAAAPDFTERLMWENFPPEVQETLQRDRIYHQPSEYADSPYPITMDLIEDGRQHLLLDRTIPLDCPVHLFQGIEDDAVPWEHALAISDKLQTEDVTITMIKDGDHRLSRDEDLQKIFAAVDRLAAGPAK
ncbi:MAG: alpha/beta hydrolase [Rhodospirillaceae bacterium]|nr:alpha/beta hydrolase [Rhodospirillaceae bacterium]|tara:strand:- start:9680 stop:10441 length:762 start_codon:yes stop_codon:yes gene_type:complete